MRPSRRLLRRIAFLAAVGLAFFAGLSVDHAARAARRGRGGPYRPLDTFAEVLAHIENAYVEEVNEKDLVYGAIEGMVGRLDPHSQFMRPDVYRSLKEETSGEFDGVGVELGVKDGALTVVAPVADAPAARAGILAGDRLLAIDGASTQGLTVPDAVGKLKGAVGTKVVLTYARDGVPAPRTVELVRERVRTQSVSWSVVDAGRGFVRVQVKSFQERTDAELGRALEAARAQLGGRIGGLVLDLRDDPGGLFDQGVRVADRFLDAGVIVSTEGRDGRHVEVERAHAAGTEPSYPLIVLVNRGTASASEIVAGALQDHGRAVILGTQTFGKGSVQSVLDLDDGSGLKLTVARYYTPRHRSIQELGITPDVVVPDAPPARVELGPGEKDLARHFHNAQAAQSAQPAEPEALEKDGPLRAAVDYLRVAQLFRTSAASPAVRAPPPSARR